MQSVTRRARRTLFQAGALLLVAAPAFALAPSALPLLSSIEGGRWLVHSSEGGSGERTICLGDAMALAQIEHGGGCSSEILASDVHGGTVRYNCQGRGFGQTQLRVETPRLVSIDTQGLIEGRPFAYRAQARRIGSC